MPQSPIISVRGLGKKYVLGETLRHDTFRDHLAGLARGLLRRGSTPRVGPRAEEFWALKDISFDVQEGEVLGIIGRNGAGKSTLLKVLSRITEPTTGEIRMHGRVASLLEVGTGFHPELTGRENVYLNGAILGMRQAEIKAKFDEIVAFSGVERFLDTPVKRYSSGMYVRLAFAVAAHLEPEILVVDEVLAVGDAEFQRKCLGKMQDVAGQGRTVLFVSHNMAAVSTLCSRAVLLHDGMRLVDGDTSSVVLKYHEHLAEGEKSGPHQTGRGNCRFVSASVTDGAGSRRHAVSLGEGFSVVMLYDVITESPETRVPNFHFCSAEGSYVFISNAPNLAECPPGRYRAECRVPGHLLNEGILSIGLAVTSYAGGRYTVEFWEKNALCVNLVDPKATNEHNYGYVGTIPGVIRPRLEWTVRQVPP